MLGRRTSSHLSYFSVIIARGNSVLTNHKVPNGDLKDKGFNSISSAESCEIKQESFICYVIYALKTPFSLPSTRSNAKLTLIQLKYHLLIKPITKLGSTINKVLYSFLFKLQRQLWVKFKNNPLINLINPNYKLYTKKYCICAIFYLFLKRSKLGLTRGFSTVFTICQERIYSSPPRSLTTNETAGELTSRNQNKHLITEAQVS